jgi:CRP/FNR family cyclic AMP-dependent transcriptional regulator
MPTTMQGLATSTKLAKLRAHALFGELGPEVIERLAACANIKKVNAGTTIFLKDDPGTGLFALSEGVVKISVPSKDGREAVLNLVYAGEIFGEIALLDGRTRTADATAMTDCELIVVDRRDFTALVRDDPKIALAMIALLCARLRWASQQFEEVVFLNLPGRLAKLLGRLGVKNASSGPQKLAITQRELSQLTNTSRESINKQLQVWAKLKWLRLERGGIVVLAPDAIAAIAAAGTERELVPPKPH